MMKKKKLYMAKKDFVFMLLLNNFDNEIEKNKTGYNFY